MREKFERTLGKTVGKIKEQAKMISISHLITVRKSKTEIKTTHILREFIRSLAQH